MSKPSEKATGYTAMGVEWLVARVEADDRLHHQLMECSSKNGLFRQGQTMNGYNSFKRIAEALSEQATFYQKQLKEHKRVLDECEKALVCLAHMATGTEQYAKEVGFKYTGDQLSMSEIPTHCPTLGDLRKCSKALAAILELKTNEKPMK